MPRQDLTAEDFEVLAERYVVMPDGPGPFHCGPIEVPGLGTRQVERVRFCLGVDLSEEFAILAGFPDVATAVATLQARFPSHSVGDQFVILVLAEA